MLVQILNAGFELFVLGGQAFVFLVVGSLIQSDVYVFIVVSDSKNERNFAEDLEEKDEVAVYVKLPGGFKIPTPLGNYNPDWAIAFEEDAVKHIYFVAETKGSMSTTQLRGTEKGKIACAKKHFEAISGKNVVYDVVDSYDALLRLVM